MKDKALADAVQKQPWDASIQALAATPDVVKRLADDIQWTTDLGNAFLAQEADVMAAVQPSGRVEPAAAKKAAPTVAAQGAKSFATPQQAADALIDAAEKFDVGALVEIFGPGGEENSPLGRISAGPPARALDFAAQAREKKSIAMEPKSQSRAFLLVGNGDWPFPVPIVKRGNGWQFDAAAGLQEIENRRIGRNELDAIEFCRGYVEAQYEYAFQPRDGYDVNQYAQHIISASGKHDGLAGQNPDGTWGGPRYQKDLGPETLKEFQKIERFNPDRSWTPVSNVE